jgi:hypothetical protein
MCVCSALSLAATSTLLITLAVKWYRERKESKGSFQQVSIHTQGYFWLVNLFVADFIQSLGLITIINQLLRNQVVPGAFCNFQGFMLNSGDIASAIWSFIIAVHTFFLLAGGRKYRTWVAENSTSGKSRWILCALVWAFIIFIGVIGLILIAPIHPEKGPFCKNVT